MWCVVTEVPADLSRKGQTSGMVQWRWVLAGAFPRPALSPQWRLSGSSWLYREELWRTVLGGAGGSPLADCLGDWPGAGLQVLQLPAWREGGQLHPCFTEEEPVEGTRTDSLKGIHSGGAVRDRPLVGDSGQLAQPLLGFRTLGGSPSLGVRFSMGRYSRVIL